MPRKITSIRFNKVQRDNDLFATVYVVGEPFYKTGMKQPIKVLAIGYVNKTKKDRLLVTFEGGQYHELGIQNDTEIFWKDVPDNTDRINKRTVRQRCAK